jgi:predicted amidophosphoribosyltransferase
MLSRHSSGLGRGGYCICPKCGEQFPHHRGIPCQDERCPHCGVKLMREGSYHHELLLKKQAQRKK